MHLQKLGRVIFIIITTRLLSNHNWPLARLWVNATREYLKLLRRRFWRFSLLLFEDYFILSLFKNVHKLSNLIFYNKKIKKFNRWPNLNWHFQGVKKFWIINQRKIVSNKPLIKIAVFGRKCFLLFTRRNRVTAKEPQVTTLCQKKTSYLTRIL